MADWDEKLVNLLVANGMTWSIAARYVDDVRLILAAIPKGWRWQGRRLQFKEEWQAEDEALGSSDTQRTSAVLKGIMNDIASNLTFTIETGEDFPNNRHPTLDTEIWIEGKKVLYNFFEKGMAAKTVMRRESALSENTKVSSLSQDVIRRLKHTSLTLPTAARVKIIDEFSRKMLTSGYKREQTKSVIEAGIKGYERAVVKHISGKRAQHQRGRDGISSRNRKKLLEKSTWFKEKETDSEDHSFRATLDEEIKFSGKRNTVKSSTVGFFLSD